MTPYLSECLLYIRVNFSDKWFQSIDTWPKIKRADFNLNRLVSLGYLEKKLENDSFFYFLIA